MADTAVTLSSNRVTVLADIERINGFSHKFTIPYSDIAQGTTSTDTVTVTLGTTPALWRINAALVNITTAFAGTTAMTINVGTTSSTSALITAQSILTAGMLPMASTVPISTNANATAARNLVAIFTNSSGGSPSALTAGELDIYINLQNLADNNLG